MLLQCQASAQPPGKLSAARLLHGTTHWLTQHLLCTVLPAFSTPHPLSCCECRNAIQGLQLI